MLSSSAFRYLKVSFYPPNINTDTFYGEYTDININAGMIVVFAGFNDDRGHGYSHGDHTGGICSLKFKFNMLLALFLFRAGASPMLICLQPPTMHQKDQKCKERSPWKELQKFFSSLSKETQYRLRPIIFTLQGPPMANWIFFSYCRIHTFFPYLNTSFISLFKFIRKMK